MQSILTNNCARFVVTLLTDEQKESDLSVWMELKDCLDALMAEIITGVWCMAVALRRRFSVSSGKRVAVFALKRHVSNS